MLAFKRIGLASVSVGIAFSLAGCSDFPGDGVIDTKELRSKASIVEVEGNVYGIKSGGVDAYAVYEHDRHALINAESDAWSAHREGNDIPKIELKYDGDETGFDLDGFQAALDEAIADADAKVTSQLEKQVEEAQQRRDKLAQELEEVSKGGEKFESYVADAKAKYKASEKALSDATDAYNGAIEGPLNKLNEIAAANDLQKVRSHQNPIRSYRSIDFKNRSIPSSCPKQPGYTAVDLISEQKMCGYIRLPSGFEPHSQEIVAATKEAMLSIPKLKEKVGKKGGWNRDATGAYASLEAAEKAYKARASEARDKFGNDNQRAYRQDHLKNKLERIDSEIARLEGEEEREHAMFMTRPDLPEEFEAAADKYIEALRKDVAENIEKGPSVTLGDKDAEFSGFSGDYEGAVVVADFIIEARNTRENFATIHYLDLTDEDVKNADSLNATIDRESVSDGRRINIRESESIEKGIMNRLRDAARERAKADKA